MIPPVPYRGSEKYIFISYAHKDSHLVWPIVQQLQEDGYRVWYDEGIDPGTEWDENIASHVSGCDYFLAFLSENYLVSENCKDELNFARDLGKPQVLMYLDPVILPPGLALRLSRCQSVDVDKNGRFYHKLYRCEGISAFTSGPVKKKKANPLPYVLLALVLAAAAALLLWPGKETPEETLPPETTVPETTVEDTTTLRKGVIVNAGGIKIAVTDLVFNEQNGLELRLQVENTTGKGGRIVVDYSYINGIDCYACDTPNISAEETSENRIWWTRQDLDFAGLEDIQDISQVTVIDAAFRLIDVEGVSEPVRFIYYPFGESYAKRFEYTPAEDDLLLSGNEHYQLYLTDHSYDENENWILEYVIVNCSDRMNQVTLAVDEINGYQMGTHANYDINPGMSVRTRMVIDEWQVTQVDLVRYAKGYIYVSDVKTHDQIASESFELYPEGDTEFEKKSRKLDKGDKVLLENEYIRVAIIDHYAYNPYSYRFQIYCENLTDEPLDLRLRDYTVNGVNDGEWSVAYVEPGEQSFRTMYCHHDNEGEKIKVSFELYVADQNGQMICSKKVNLKY